MDTIEVFYKKFIIRIVKVKIELQSLGMGF